MLGNVYAKQRDKSIVMHTRNLSSFIAEAKGVKRGLAKAGIAGLWKIMIESC